MSRYAAKARPGESVSQWLNGQPEPWWTLAGEQPAFTSNIVNAVADTTAHTKGAWAELVASTSADVSRLWVRVSGVQTSATNTATLLDFAVGASGSEQVIAENIAVGGASGGASFLWFDVPAQISASSRISCRIQSVVTGGKTAGVQIAGFSYPQISVVPTTVDVLGGNTASSTGVQLLANQSWVQVSASTTVPYRALVIVASVNTASEAGFTLNVSVGVGAAGSEVTLGERSFTVTNAESILNNGFLFGNGDVIDAHIPVGSRIAVKGNPTADNRNGVVVIGIPA